MANLITDFLKDMLTGFLEIFGAPFKDPQVLWQLLPIILLMIVLQAYFATHKKETLGWNTALGNGISLFWICITMMQKIFTDFGIGRFLIVLMALFYSFFIMYISFTHRMSSQLSFFLAGTVTIYFLACIAVLGAYNLIELRPAVIADFLLIYLTLMGISWAAKKRLPEMKEEEDMTESEF